MHRRDFLSSLAAVPALAALQPQQNARPAAHRRGLKLGTVTYNIAKDWDLPTLIKNLSVKVRPNGMPKDVSEERTLEQIGKALRECGAFARDHGVTIQLEVHGETTSRL